MKKLLITASVLAAFAGMNAQAASTGTITFNGELTATTCDVVVDNQAADATIQLPTLGINQLATAGSTAGETSFNMALTNCAGTLTTASAFFENGLTVDTDGRLKNTATDTAATDDTPATTAATNVSLELLNGTTGDVIVAGNDSQVDANSYVSIATGSAVLPYSVRYYATGATTAGLVGSNVVYSIQYK
ncbi:fimbrial protein [Pantoea sp. MBD-2R]|uniref:fimbrial protein n=1 Tax=Pantoea sp. MBD-2R TaxID=3141540 RepID=UPI0031840A4C